MACGARTDNLFNETSVHALLCAVAAMVVLAAAYAAARLREACRAGGLRQKVSSLARRLASACLGEGDAGTPLGALVEARRVQRAEVIIRWSLILAAPLLAVTAHSAYSSLRSLCTTSRRYEYWPGWPDVDMCLHKSTMLFIDNELLPLTLFALYSGFFVVTGVRLTGRILDISSAAFMLFWMFRGMLQDTFVYGNDHTDGQRVRFSEKWEPLAMLFQAISFGNFRFLAKLMPATYFIRACYGLIIFVQCDAGLALLHRFMKLNVSQLLFILFITWCVDSSARAECAKTLEAADSTNAATLASRLLAGFCDAVVNTGPDLDIQRQSKLDSLLMLAQGRTQRRAGELDPLVGRSLMDFVVDGERERVCSFLKAPGDELEKAEDSAEVAGVASTIHTHLRDASGVSLSVQLFHACLSVPLPLGVGHSYLHIVGIKEDNEDLYRVASPGGAAPALAGPWVPPPAGAPAEEASEDTRSHIGSVVDFEVEVEATFDPDSNDLALATASPSFKGVFGKPGPSASVLSLVVGREREQFEDWIHDASEEFGASNGITQLTIPKASGWDAMGIVVHDVEGQGLKIAVIGEGAIKAHNEANPDKLVHEGSIIFAANDVSQEPQALLDEIDACCEVDLMIQANHSPGAPRQQLSSLVVGPRAFHFNIPHLRPHRVWLRASCSLTMREHNATLALRDLKWIKIREQSNKFRKIMSRQQPAPGQQGAPAQLAVAAARAGVASSPAPERGAPASTIQL